MKPRVKRATNETKAQERARVKGDVDAFLSSGGKIKLEPPPSTAWKQISDRPESAHIGPSAKGKYYGGGGKKKPVVPTHDDEGRTWKQK
jgi:hypothetical protein